jgi:hypothetical protein
MCSPTDFVLWANVRKADWGAVLREGQVLPRYAQYGDVREYVGLCETPEAALTSRVLSNDSDVTSTDFYFVKVILTPLGFMRFSTDMYRPGLPRFHKVVYAGGKDHGVWRFYGGVPFSADEPATCASLLRLELIADCDVFSSVT